MKVNPLLVLAVLWFLRKDQPAQHTHAPSHAGVQREGTLTPLVFEQASATIAQTFKRIVGREPTLREHAMLMAHSALEVGRWKKMRAWNFGFVTTTGDRDYFMVPGNALKFRVYGSADEGCADWIDQLQKNWPGAWAALGSDDPHAYVQGLIHGRLGSYFGDPATVGPGYERTVAALYAEFKIALGATPEA